jgi:O-antigen/teichoic acid export membrane protein
MAVAAYAVLCNGAPFVIATRWGAEQVTSYAVTMRIVTLATGILYVLLSPLWPAYSEASAGGDTAWVRTAFRRSISAAAPLFGLGFIVLALFGKPVIRIWIGSGSAVPSTSMLWACAVFGLLSIWNVLASTLLNGLGKFFGQGTYGLACAIGFLWVSTHSAGSWGPEGVIWIIDAGYALRCALMALEVKRLHAKRLRP